MDNIEYHLDRIAAALESIAKSLNVSSQTIKRLEMKLTQLLIQKLILLHIHPCYLRKNYL